MAQWHGQRWLIMTPIKRQYASKGQAVSLPTICRPCHVHSDRILHVLWTKLPPIYVIFFFLDMSTHVLLDVLFLPSTLCYVYNWIECLDWSANRSLCNIVQSRVVLFLSVPPADLVQILFFFFRVELQLEFSHLTHTSLKMRRWGHWFRFQD